MDSSYLVVVASDDPVAARVAERWGTPDPTGWVVEGAPIRRLSGTSLLLRRPGPHVRDEQLDLLLPEPLRRARPTLVFPSIHRSVQNVECLAVHPLGNPGPDAEVGGRPRTLVPTDPRRMTDCLRRVEERARGSGVSVTFEATHHGPELGLPGFFVEVGFGLAPEPPAPFVRILSEVIPDLAPDPNDRVALGVGGGHYVPHFTDLALHRRWAFGHLLSRHALATLDAPTAHAAWDQTEGAEGTVYARVADASLPVLAGIGPRLRDVDAPRRGGAADPTSASRSASGT